MTLGGHLFPIVHNEMQLSARVNPMLMNIVTIPRYLQRSICLIEEKRTTYTIGYMGGYCMQ